MNSKRTRSIVAPVVLGAMFVAFLFLSGFFGDHILFIAIATAISVAVSYLIWPIRLVVVALVMIVVATALPVLAMYIVANSGEETVSLGEIISLLSWWKNLVPLATATITAYLLKHVGFRSEKTC